MGALGGGRGRGRVFLADGARGWVASRAGSWLFGYLGLGSAVPVPHVPGHPTSICDKGIKKGRYTLMALQ